MKRGIDCRLHDALRARRMNSSTDAPPGSFPRPRHLRKTSSETALTLTSLPSVASNCSAVPGRRPKESRMGFEIVS